jgi:biopolymer transport protein ExbB
MKARNRNGTLSKIKSLTEQGQHDEAQTLTKETPGPVSAVIAETLQHKRQMRLAIEEAISLKGSSEIKKLSKNLHILELIGLLGSK